MRIDIPGYKILDLNYLVLDYNGTIAIDGRITEAVRKQLGKLAELYEIYVVTADTHGTAGRNCADLPVHIHTFPSGAAAYEKEKIVEALGKEQCVCMGNAGLRLCRRSNLAAKSTGKGLYEILGKDVSEEREEV